MSIINRIIEIVENESPHANFTRKTGISSSNIANWRKNSEKKINSDILEAILEGYPNLSAEWLMRGIGLKLSKEIDISENIITKVNEPTKINDKEEKLKCVLTGDDCSFREMDTLRSDNMKLRRKNEQLNEQLNDEKNKHRK